MQRTRRTPLSEPDSSHPAGDAPVESTEPADAASAGSPSSPEFAQGDTAAAEDNAVPAEANTASGSTQRKRSWKWTAVFAAVGLLVLGLDQLTKVLALQHLTPGEPVNVIGTFLKFNLIRNSGAAFSLGAGYTPVIATIQITVAIGVIYLSRKLGSAGWAVAFGFLFGGAVGNIVDRIFREPSPFHGHVVDFLQTPHWAIFNVADMAVTSAACLLVIQTLRGVRLDGTREHRK
jgi:signal peptidase II